MQDSVGPDNIGGFHHVRKSRTCVLIISYPFQMLPWSEHWASSEVRQQTGDGESYFQVLRSPLSSSEAEQEDCAAMGVDSRPLQGVLGDDPRQR